MRPSILVLLAVALSACSSPTPSIGETQTGPFTSGELALSNLDARIEALTTVWQQRPDDPYVRGELAANLVARTHYAGSYDDFVVVDTLTTEALERWPSRSDSHALRASYLSSVHRFQEAAAELDAAEALGGTDVSAARATLLVATGAPIDALYETRADLASRFPSYRTFSDLATVEAALGRFDDADAHYEAAVASYRDVSPFPVAWVAFQRGVMWGEMANQPDRSVPHYETAVRLIPSYVVANVHLAEQEVRLGRFELALARLERVASITDDPEPIGKLASLLSTGDPGRSAALVAEAARRYEQLLAIHEEAFRDHAAEFFMGPGGDVALALELARDNLSARRTARALGLAIRAALAAGEVGLACDWSQEAGALAAIHPSLASIVEATSASCL